MKNKDVKTSPERGVEGEAPAPPLPRRGGGGDASPCKIANCKRPYQAKGYCNVHYKKWRNEGPHKRFKICHQEGCRKPMVTWGLCEEHYKAKAGVKEEAAPAPAPAETPTETPPPTPDATPAA